MAIDREFIHDHQILIATAEACWRKENPSYSWHVLDWLCWKQRVKHPLVWGGPAVTYTCTS
jgi:hypothetical protein